jgi:hypothetical protein
MTGSKRGLGATQGEPLSRDLRFAIGDLRCKMELGRVASLRISWNGGRTGTEAGRAGTLGPFQ